MGRRRKKVSVKKHTSLAIDDWAVSSRLNVIIAIVAQQIVACAQSVYEACREARAKPKPGSGIELPYPGNNRWMYFYDYPDEPLVRASSLIFQEKSWHEVISGENPKLDELLEGQERFLSDGPVTSDSFQVFLARGQIAAREIYRGHILKLQDEILGKDDATPEQIKTIKASPEILFMMRVLVPCWVEYHIPFDELLSQARTGDIDAIEKLLRVDRTASDDPLIRRHHRSAQRSGVKGWVDRYARALEFDAEPLGVFSLRHIKYWLAGYIYEMAAVLSERLEKFYRKVKMKFKRGYKPKNKLSYSDILELFHCYARDVYPRNDKNSPAVIMDKDFRDIEAKSFEARVRETREFWRRTFISAIAESDAEMLSQSESSVQ